MSEQLYRRVVRTDGHAGHWYDYEPVEERTICNCGIDFDNYQEDDMCLGCLDESCPFEEYENL